ncbi:hypothetical protein Riv7116_4536 [Rivularia sp. PCC 7116]|uniref:hypothetical protein n=1 Tax=Rivularia sp. PCC 7116 TaxID=373994 RepID=UPI00029F33CC|nr:hypothetical protein [Rivularia sp. PCC 7116]AFY56956.1 hypothetical protein Riv7116_4536 [Rivularia sp. PCC 7116]
MSIIQQLPWVSLTLVLLTYSVFGWILSKENLPLFAWLMIGISVLLLVAAITTPWSKAVKYVKFLFNTKLKSFLLAVLGAFLFFLVFAEFRIFLDIMLIISATILVRLDFQVAGISENKAFLLTSLFSIVGLMSGILLDYLLS